MESPSSQASSDGPVKKAATAPSVKSEWNTSTGIQRTSAITDPARQIASPGSETRRGR
jgi:hypothetical protein